MDKCVAIIIVTYNASKYLGELFSSLEKINYPRDKFEIVVVDNASTDETVNLLRAMCPGLGAQSPELKARSSKPRAQSPETYKLIPLQTNTGFTGGNNIGLQYSIDNGFDYAYMLNQDTVVDPNFIKETIQVAESDEKIGAVQSLLLLYDKKDTINSAGNHIHYLGFAYAGGNGQKAQSSELRAQGSEITYPSGAAVLLRCSVLKKIGLLTPELFMYHEDVDLGWRIWLSGYKAVLAPKSIVYHKYEFSRSMKKYYYMERNRYIVMFQNYKIGTLLLIFPALCVMDFCMLIYSFFSGFFKEELSAWLYFFKCSSWKKIFENRKIVQSQRLVKDREVIKRFTGKIEFQDITNPIVKYFFNPIFYLYWSVIRAIIIW